MQYRLVFFVLGAVLAGGGCAAQENLSLRVAQPIHTLLRDRPIAQVQGFGAIPKPPSPQLRPGVSGSVRVTAEMPSLPPTITVLRLKSGRPNDAELRNMASAFGIPGGTMGAVPVSRELRIEWKDGEGVRWSYQGSERRIDFADESQDLKTLTVSEWPDRERILQSAIVFLDEHGVGRRRFGGPYVEPDWQAWWEGQRSEERCMGRQMLDIVRTLAATPLLTYDDLPRLPFAKNTTCVHPEFPSRIVVRMNASQDGQGIFSAGGSPLHGATLILDASTRAPISGSFLVHTDPDRSDYPAVTEEEASGALARGGLGGTPNGDATVSEITFEWLFLRDASDPSTTYLYPALIGQGTILRPDGKTAPYRIVVPLVK